MSYSISFLPPSQSRAASIARPHNGTQPTSTAGTSCQESRTYLNKLNEQQQALVKPLIARVEHWKGHCLCSFGKPLLQAKAMVSRIPVGGETHTHEITTRQYQIFLFSNILICCRKRSQPNAQGRDWTMKGRVFLRNIYDVQRTGGKPKGDGPSSQCTSYSRLRLVLYIQTLHCISATTAMTVPMISLSILPGLPYLADGLMCLKPSANAPLNREHWRKDLRIAISLYLHTIPLFPSTEAHPIPPYTRHRWKGILR